MTIFYRDNDGYAVIGNFDGAGNFTAAPPVSFTPGFTQITEATLSNGSAAVAGTLFYNANDGSAVVGLVEGANFQAFHSYNPGSLTPGFTQIVSGSGTLFYNANDGSAVLGRFDGAGNFVTIQQYSLTPGFTQIVSADGTLFYNANDGSAVLGRFDSSGNFATIQQYSLTPGFTTVE